MNGFASVCFSLNYHKRSTSSAKARRPRLVSHHEALIASYIATQQSVIIRVRFTFNTADDAEIKFSGLRDRRSRIVHPMADKEQV